MINISKLYCGRAGQSDALRYPKTRDIKPIVVYNCTPKCNLRCVHCYSNSDVAASGVTLSTVQAKQLIDRIVEYQCPVLLFSGGEPLMREDLFELMDYARARGLRTVLSTNGTLITVDVAGRLAELGLSYAGISLDGPEHLHDAFRGVDGAFKRTIRGIQNCEDAGIRTGLRFTMTRGNIGQIEQVFNVAHLSGIRRICFYHLIRSGRATAMDADVPTSAQTRKSLDRIIQFTAEYVENDWVDEVFTVGNHADGVYLLQKMMAGRHPNTEKAKTLLAQSAGNRIGQNICSINWDGQVYPDQFWRTHSLGNIMQQSFAEIWDNEDEPVMRVLRSKDECRDEKCTRCKWFDYCKGNYRSLDGGADVSNWANEPECFLSEDEIALNA